MSGRFVPALAMCREKVVDPAPVEDFAFRIDGSGFGGYGRSNSVRKILFEIDESLAKGAETLQMFLNLSRRDCIIDISKLEFYLPRAVGLAQSAYLGRILVRNGTVDRGKNHHSGFGIPGWNWAGVLFDVKQPGQQNGCLG